VVFWVVSGGWRYFMGGHARAQTKVSWVYEWGRKSLQYLRVLSSDHVLSCVCN